MIHACEEDQRWLARRPDHVLLLRGISQGLVLPAWPSAARMATSLLPTDFWIDVLAQLTSAHLLNATATDHMLLKLRGEAIQARMERVLGTQVVLRPQETNLMALRFVDLMDDSLRHTVALGEFHAVALRDADSEPYSWGGADPGTWKPADQDEDADKDDVWLAHLGHNRWSGPVVRVPTRMDTEPGGNLEEQYMRAALELDCVDVSVGLVHSLVVLSNGTACSCGAGGYYTGHGSADIDSVEFSGYEGDVGARQLCALEIIAGLSEHRVLRVAAGMIFSLVATAQGLVFSFGNGSSGALGHGTRDTEKLPRLVEALTSTRVVDISAGSSHCLATTEDGLLYSWGGAHSGALGLGPSTNLICTPSVVPLANRKARQVSAAGQHSLVVCSQRHLFSFGTNDAGELGLGDHNPRYRPVRVTAIESAAAAAAGQQHSVVLATDGAVYTFGQGRNGQLGHGTLRCEPSPRRLDSASLAFLPSAVYPPSAPTLQVVEVAAGNGCTVLRMSNGLLYAFGDNSTGLLGNDAVDMMDRPSGGVPVPVPVLQCWFDDGEKDEGTQSTEFDKKWCRRGLAADKWARERAAEIKQAWQSLNSGEDSDD